MALFAPLMWINEIERFAFLVVFVGFIIWIIVRSNNAQKAAAKRLQILREQENSHFQQAMESSARQTDALNEILAEMKAIRKAIESKTGDGEP